MKAERVARSFARTRTRVKRLLDKHQHLSPEFRAAILASVDAHAAYLTGTIRAREKKKNVASK